MQRSRFVHIALWSVVGTLLVAGLVLVGMQIRHLAKDRPHGDSYFASVIQGRVYRSGQPSKADWQQLKDRLGVRTVINLRNPKENDEELQVEPGAAAHAGVRHVSMPIHHSVPTPEQVREFLRLVRDPANEPILIHCEVGVQRTGVMTAVYRMEMQGWSPQQAFDEYLSFSNGSRNRPGRQADLVHDFLFNFRTLMDAPAASQPDRAR